MSDASSHVVAHRDFLNIADLSSAENDAMLRLAERMRTGAYDAKPLARKALAMIFMKSSTRTRMLFEVGATQLGGTAHSLSPRDVQIGRCPRIAAASTSTEPTTPSSRRRVSRAV